MSLRTCLWASLVCLAWGKSPCDGNVAKECDGVRLLCPKETNAGRYQDPDSCGRCGVTPCCPAEPDSPPAVYNITDCTPGCGACWLDEDCWEENCAHYCQDFAYPVEESRRKRELSVCDAITVVDTLMPFFTAKAGLVKMGSGGVLDRIFKQLYPIGFPDCYEDNTEALIRSIVGAKISAHKLTVLKNKVAGFRSSLEFILYRRHPCTASYFANLDGLLVNMMDQKHFFMPTDTDDSSALIHLQGYAILKLGVLKTLRDEGQYYTDGGYHGNWHEEFAATAAEFFEYTEWAIEHHAQVDGGGKAKDIQSKRKKLKDMTQTSMDTWRKLAKVNGCDSSKPKGIRSCKGKKRYDTVYVRNKSKVAIKAYNNNWLSLNDRKKGARSDGCPGRDNPFRKKDNGKWKCWAEVFEIQGVGKSGRDVLRFGDKVRLKVRGGAKEYFRCFTHPNIIDRHRVCDGQKKRGSDGKAEFRIFSRKPSDKMGDKIKDRDLIRLASYSSRVCKTVGAGPYAYSKCRNKTQCYVGRKSNGRFTPNICPFTDTDDWDKRSPKETHFTIFLHGNQVFVPPVIR